MRKALVVLLAVAMLAPLAVAELQNVEVGGSLQIRGNWFTGEIMSWDDDWGNTLAVVEERTRLNVKADFSDQVSAYIELDSYDIWGEDFRSNWLTGADGRAASISDVEAYQAYVEANEMWGQPLRLRVGRQEIALGSEWLIGTNDSKSWFTGLSFDGVRVTYTPGDFTIDAIWAKLADTSPVEEDGDVDLYVLYGSYAGIENITLDAYWMYVRDARGLVPDTPSMILLDIWENWWGLDQWEPTGLNTIGLRGAGKVFDDRLDFEAELAYQFGNADEVGRMFRYWYSDNEADYDNFGLNLEVGYTFDCAWTPRPYLGFVYLDGEDNRTPENFGEWIYSLLPWSRAEASMGFNRLFSNWEYSEFIDNTNLSNAWIVRAGVSVSPTEKVKLALALSYYETVDGREDGWLGLRRWWSDDENDTIGVEAGLNAVYDYSEDLQFEAGYAHLFVEDGLTDGNFVVGNGLANRPGTGDDDADYVYVQTKICF